MKPHNSLLKIERIVCRIMPVSAVQVILTDLNKLFGCNVNTCTLFLQVVKKATLLLGYSIVCGACTGALDERSQDIRIKNHVPTGCHSSIILQPSVVVRNTGKNPIAKLHRNYHRPVCQTMAGRL